MTQPTPAQRIRSLQREVKQLRKALITAIAWIAQSAGSPLSVENAEELIRMAEKK